MLKPILSSLSVILLPLLVFSETNFPAIYSPAYLTGRFDYQSHPDFIEIALPYAAGPGLYLRREAYEAFRHMHAAAKKDNVSLVIISATRDFKRQRQIWEAKWSGSRPLDDGANAATAHPDPETRALAIMKYSSMPGTSRHHWGTDIDLNRDRLDYFRSGPGKATFDWLTAHAASFGFCQTYSPKNPQRPTGYDEEPWHWSYFPTAGILTEYARTHLENEMIVGFSGSETAVRLDVVSNFVLGINPACMAEPAIR